VKIVREFATQPLLAKTVGVETVPSLGVMSDAEIGDWIERNVLHYYHPVGTCKMGPADDPGAVVDSRDKVHGLDGLYVADASLIPVVPRANTNIPAAVVGERVASWLIEEPS
jgi:choline dehydrogenase